MNFDDFLNGSTCLKHSVACSNVFLQKKPRAVVRLKTRTLMKVTREF